MGSGETSVGLSDTDAAMPVGVAGPSWRASGVTLPLASSGTGGNPWQQRRLRRGPSCGADWYRCYGALELGGGPSVGAVAVKLLRFRRSAVVGILFFCCFSFVSFGCDCAASPPAPILVVSVGCFGIQSGGKSFFVKLSQKHNTVTHKKKGNPIVLFRSKTRPFFFFCAAGR